MVPASTKGAFWIGVPCKVLYIHAQKIKDWSAFAKSHTYMLRRCRKTLIMLKNTIDVFLFLKNVSPATVQQYLTTCYCDSANIYPYKDLFHITGSFHTRGLFIQEPVTEPQCQWKFVGECSSYHFC